MQSRILFKISSQSSGMSNYGIVLASFEFPQSTSVMCSLQGWELGKQAIASSEVRISQLIQDLNKVRIPGVSRQLRKCLSLTFFRCRSISYFKCIILIVGPVAFEVRSLVFPEPEGPTMSTLNSTASDWSMQAMLPIFIIMNNQQEEEQVRLGDMSELQIEIQKTQLVAKTIKLNHAEGDFYHYPASLQLAELHRQCYYLLPDSKFVMSAKEDACPCCKQVPYYCSKKLEKQRFNVFTVDMYKLLVDKYGLTMPLYFTFIKFQIGLQVLMFLLYGLFYQIKVNKLCTREDMCEDPTTDLCNVCQFKSFYNFIDIEHFVAYVKEDDSDYSYFKFSVFCVFLLIVLQPLFYELLIRYRQYQYWDKEPVNFQQEDRKSVLASLLNVRYNHKDLRIMFQKAILNDSNQAIKRKFRLMGDEDAIREVLYIYDYNQLNELNLKREQKLLDFLLTVKQIEEVNELGVVKTLPRGVKGDAKQTYTLQQLNDRFGSQYQELTELTGKVMALKKDNLPFTNKAIIKFKSTQQQQAVLMHFRKTFCENVKIIYLLVKESLTSVQEGSNLNTDMNTQLEEPPQEKGILRVKKAFRADEIFWLNLGIPSSVRAKLQAKSALMIFLVFIVLMGGYEGIYIYQLSNKKKVAEGEQLSAAQRVLTILFTILCALLSTYANIQILIQTIRSKRTAFTELEVNRMHYLIFLQYCWLNLVPVVLILEYWDGRAEIVAASNLVQLFQTRIIIKNIFHTLHIRHTKYWFSKRAILKNFNPFHYFQGQLNSLLMPPAYPVRGRLYLILFNLTVSSTLIYFCPVMILICLAFNIYIYFFDKYALCTNYRIDPDFNIDHMSEIVKSYQFILLPFNIYLFIRLFYDHDWLPAAAAPVSAIIVLMMLFKRKAMVNFILNNLLNQRKKRDAVTKFKDQSYIEEYDKFVKSLRIDLLSTKLTELSRQIVKS